MLFLNLKRCANLCRSRLVPGYFVLHQGECEEFPGDGSSVDARVSQGVQRQAGRPEGPSNLRQNRERDTQQSIRGAPQKLFHSFLFSPNTKNFSEYYLKYYSKMT